MSISFNIPAGTYQGRAVSATTVKADRGFSESNKITVKTYKGGDQPLEFIKVDGINELKTTIRFTVNNRLVSDILDISKYLESLKSTSVVTITYPDASTKTVLMSDWSITMVDSLRASLQVNAELVY